jgi:AraC family transcriptional regulator, transcriptional activator of pobA
MKRGARTVALDRLPDPADAAKVLWLRDLDFGEPREPHRHDYHELVWIRSGRGEHVLDGQQGGETKELVTDRVMLAAARLMRFTDLTAQEVAFRVGFADPLYFSRAFERRFGEAPSAYGERVTGLGTPAGRDSAG